MTKAQMIRQAEKGPMTVGELNAFLYKLAKLPFAMQRNVLKQIQDQIEQAEITPLDRAEVR